MAPDPLYLFVFIGMFSPGPNVILLTASGARFGFRATLPHVVGVALGVGVIGAVAGSGVAALLLARPGLVLVLKIIAAAWILWMAWALFRSHRSKTEASRARPFRVHEAVLFQWVNPKIWAVTLAASSGYSVGLAPMDEAFRLASAFTGINFFVCLFWTGAGFFLRLLLETPAAWRSFTTIMAAGLAASAAMVFL